MNQTRRKSKFPHLLYSTPHPFPNAKYEDRYVDSEPEDSGAEEEEEEEEVEDADEEEEEDTAEASKPKRRKLEKDDEDEAEAEEEEEREDGRLLAPLWLCFHTVRNG